MSSALFDNTQCTRIVDFYACITLGEHLDYKLHWKRCGYIDRDDSLVSSSWTTDTTTAVNQGIEPDATWIVIDPAGKLVGDVFVLENTINTVNQVRAVARINVTVE